MIELSFAKLNLKRLFRMKSDETYCDSCRREVDRTICWCGDSGDHGWIDNHSAIHSGCCCLYTADHFIPNGIVRKLLNLPLRWAR